MKGIQRSLFTMISVLLFASAVRAQALDTATIDRALGRSGHHFGQVYKIGFPRTDLHVLIAGVAIKPGLALGSWAAFTGSDHDATVMGDLVLLGKEVDPVMRALRSRGFEITALHNHLLGETPRVLYMHYMGHGSASQLARTLREALAASRTPLGKPAAAPASSAAPPGWVRTVEEALGREGGFGGGVLSVGVPRAGPITEGGMRLSPAQGVAESINFQAAGRGKIAATGDFVLTAEEINPVISALEQHDIRVTALHTHMLTEHPRLFFLHFWGLGGPAAVARGIGAALEQIAIK
jgi:Domain of Unknown Function (DUF1259)